MKPHNHVLNRERDRLIRKVRALKPDLAKEIMNLDFSWFRIRNEDQNRATVFVYDEIDPYWGMSADDFVKELNEITAQNIDVRINSPGGSVFDCIAMYNALVMHPANITVYVDSLAASGASIIAMAGEECVMMVGAQMMIHDALGIEMGNAADMRAFADFLDRQSDNIATIYAHKAGGDASDWRARMLAETWLSAEEAVEIGLADRIYSQGLGEGEGTEEGDGDGESENPDEAPNEEPPDRGTEEEPPEGDNIEDLIDSLMNRQHALTNRNWKYPGRRRAPDPISNSVGMNSAFGPSIEFLDTLINQMFSERE